jgi:AAA domain
MIDDPILASADRIARGAHPEGPDLLGGLRNGAWLDRQDFPPLRYAVPGVIPEGSTLLVGAPKIGKSWMVLGYALAKAAGGVALSSIKVDAAPVLYLALEDGDRRMQSRCRTLLEGGPIPPAFDYLTHVEPGRIVETITVWIARHPGAAPLVILDTLGKVMPPALNGESAYQRDYRIGSALKRLTEAEPGAALLVNHHDRKATADDFVDSVSGTHGLAGAADTTVVLVRARNDAAGLIKVTGRDIPEGEYAVTFERGSTWQLDGHDLDDAARIARLRVATAGLGDRSADILALVAEHPGIGPTDLGTALGIEPKHAGTYLGRLVAAGRIVKTGRGNYRLHTSVETVESGEIEGHDRAARFHTSTVSTPPPGGRTKWR